MVCAAPTPLFLEERGIEAPLLFAREGVGDEFLILVDRASNRAYFVL